MDPEAQLLIELARETDTPSSQDRARVRRVLTLTLGASVLASASGSVAAPAGAVAGQVAASGGGAVTTGAAAMAAVKGTAGAAGAGLAVASTASMGLAKLATWGGIGFIAGATTLGVTVVAVDAVRSGPATALSSSMAPKSASAPVQSGALAQSFPDESSEPSEPGLQGDIAETAPPRPAADPMPSAIASPPSNLPVEHLVGELPLIEQAQQALRQGNPQRAMSLLAEHERSFPNGTLAEERLAGKALALCQLGQTAASRQAADVLRRFNPHSPLWPRVAKACGFDD